MENEFVRKRISEMRSKIKASTTEDLQALLNEQLKEESENFNMFECLFAMEELKRRRGELDTPERKLQWKMFTEYYFPVSLRDDEERTDPATGIVLTPSWHGEDCAGNGEHGECCCDECDHYPACFPDWKSTTETH